MDTPAVPVTVHTCPSDRDAHVHAASPTMSPESLHGHTLARAAPPSSHQAPTTASSMLLCNSFWTRCWWPWRRTPTAPSCPYHTIYVLCVCTMLPIDSSIRLGHSASACRCPLPHPNAACDSVGDSVGDSVVTRLVPLVCFGWWQVRGAGVLHSLVERGKPERAGPNAGPVRLGGGVRGLSK